MIYFVCQKSKYTLHCQILTQDVCWHLAVDTGRLWLE